MEVSTPDGETWERDFEASAESSELLSEESIDLLASLDITESFTLGCVSSRD